jgi:hypothetical protein
LIYRGSLFHRIHSFRLNLNNSSKLARDVPPENSSDFSSVKPRVFSAASCGPQ